MTPTRLAVLRHATRVLADVRALGAAAPLRGAYEASKRTNFHKVLFREVNPRIVETSTLLGLGAEVPSDSRTRERCLTDAAQILAEGTRVFGRRVHTGVFATWSCDPITEKEWANDLPWWRIDIRTDDRLSDVKFVWEAGRHRDMVVLARATALDPEGPWADGLTSMLTRWCDECPPERGVHWYSSLELALRSVAWAQVLALAGDRMTARLRARVDHQLVASARHILVELPYTVSSMRNNHLLGDGLGLVVLGNMFPGRAGARWRGLGDKLMLSQLKRHMRPDGSMIEDSLSYHRFVLEMFVVRHILGDAPPRVTRAMRDAALHLVNLGVLEGAVPQFGDWDEGRVLADSAPAGSVVGSTLLALALSGHAVPAEAWDEHDELAWYAPRIPGHLPFPTLGAEVTRAGNFMRMAAGQRTVWFKGSGAVSHQHADLSSLWVSDADGWIIEDPGTGTYNGPLEIRNGFRTSTAHPVWCPDGDDQLQPHRAFRWLRSVNSRMSDAVKIGDSTAVLSVHDAFSASAGRVARLVVVGSNGVTVFDSVEEPQGTWTMTLPLGASAGRGVDVVGLDDLTFHRGEASPMLGWHSRTYGTWEEATWLRTSTTFDKDRVWGVGAVDSDLSANFVWGPMGVVAQVRSGETDAMVAVQGVQKA